MLVRMKSIRPIPLSSLPCNRTTQRVDDPGGRIPRRIDVVISGREHTFEPLIVKATSVGKDPIDSVVGHLGGCAVLVPVVVVWIACAERLHSRLFALGHYIVSDLFQSLQGLTPHAHLVAQNWGL